MQTCVVTGHGGTVGLISSVGKASDLQVGGCRFELNPALANFFVLFIR